MTSSIIVDKGSAVIGGDFSLAKVDFTPHDDPPPLGDVIVFHLTHGVDLSNPDQSAAAFRIDGQVKIVDSGSARQGFEIAFLQFVRFNSMGLFYAGRTPK